MAQELSVAVNVAHYGDGQSSVVKNGPTTSTRTRHTRDGVVAEVAFTLAPRGALRADVPLTTPVTLSVLIRELKSPTAIAILRSTQGVMWSAQFSRERT